MAIEREARASDGPVLEIGQPTSVRWRIVGLLMALCFISHMNRVSISVAADERLMQQYAISEKQMGVVYSAFLMVYTLFMIPGGTFIDRFGPRLALSVMAFGSGIFGAITGFTGLMFAAGAQIWTALVIVRSIMGLMTVPLHPASARCVSNWLPFEQRTVANGLVTGAALLGIACTYKIFGALIDRFDWPIAFVITGTCTVVLAAIWSRYVADDPSQHRHVNRAERQWILQHRGRASDEPASVSKPWLSLLKNRSLILLTFSYAAVGYFQYLFFYWIHYYFKNVLHLGAEESRWYAGVPTFVMAVSMPLGGILSDHLQRKYGRTAGSKIVPIGGMLASAVFLILGLVVQEPKWVAIWFAVSMGSVGLCEGPFWLTAVELGGRNGGSTAAIMNTGGNGIGLVAPMLTPVISEYLGWQWAFSLAGLVCILGGLCWLGIRQPASES
jgi:MFS transporter, ACS family, D-galactonate transporter